MTKEQLTALLNDMSLEEKVNQMSQVIGGFFDDDTVITGPMAEMGFTEENIELSGSVIGSMGAETVKKSRNPTWKNIRIISRCYSCWTSSMATKPYFRFRWDREQPLSRSFQKNALRSQQRGIRQWFACDIRPDDGSGA